MKRLAPQKQNDRFAQAVIPHLDAAYNLARWLTRNDHDAEDMVQEAYLRAFRFFGGFRGGDARAWLLKIVRNTCYTWRTHNRAQDLATEFDEEIHSQEANACSPEKLMLQSAEGQMVRQALEELPVEFRETLILRELDGLSYKEIADVTGISIGTVMSRLSRARQRLEKALVTRAGKGR